MATDDHPRWDRSWWYPVGLSDDAPYRHVAQTKLFGRELALWRADDGYLNAWENRCLHRGVRLSVGQNEGTELRCTYHGWRYSSRTGGCTYIPAHPADAPAQTICNRTFPCAERYGLIWVTEQGEGQPPSIPALEAGRPFPLRPLPFNAPAELVLERLADYHFQPSPLVDHDERARLEVVVTATALDPHGFELRSRLGDTEDTLIGFLQPVDAAHCVVRGALADGPVAAEAIGVLRHHADQLERFRTLVETVATESTTPEPDEPELERVAVADKPDLAPTQRRQAGLRVVVTRKWATAEGVAAFQLDPVGAALPTAQPGAHIDVHLPNGLVRQYSLTNRAGDQEHYVIGVKLEPDSRGGSACLHESVREGDVLAISAPRNNFTLRRDATRTVLVAGGIGITPLLAMAETLHAGRHPFELHAFARSERHLAFSSRLDRLGASVRPHLGLSPAETEAELARILADYQPWAQVYVCGPGPMLDSARTVATDAGWPEAAIHFEYFENTTELDQSSAFEISLARSALTLSVEAGQTILDVLQANGIPVDSSCEQGACGTCIVGVLDGDPLHQDVYLKPSEREAGTKITTCVSRARSHRLVLDI